MLQTTVVWDWGVIATAFAPTSAIIVTAIVAWFAYRRTQVKEKLEREIKDKIFREERAAIAATAARAAEAILQQGNATHVLVNDQLTREKASRLILLKSHRAVLVKVLGKDAATEENMPLFQSLDDQIEALEDEIKQRDVAAGTLLPSGASKP